VSLAWDASALPVGSQLRGYRLMRDGEVITQVAALSADIGNLAPKSTHDWTVAAVDTQGQASAPSPATRVVQSDPPPTTGGVHAYLLASTDASFAAFREHYQQIGVVYPTFFDCNAASGLIEGTNNPAIVSFAQDRKVKVMPRFYCQRTAILHRILTDPAMREQWLQTTVDMVDQNGWDGVNIDFEAAAATDRDALTSFMAELSDRLHAQGKLLSQAVSAKVRDIPDHPRSGVFDYPALAQYDDYIFVMAWGVHWATSAPGAQDDLTWVRQIRDYVATMPQKQKFIMGTMLYGMDWPAGGGPGHGGQGLQYSEIQALAGRFGAASVFDPTQDSWHLTYTDDAGVPHDVWYSDAAAVGDRVALAREQGLGVGFWRIGQEDEAIWSDPRLPAAG
jgi:spore germination protein YaaH